MNPLYFKVTEKKNNFMKKKYCKTDFYESEELFAMNETN